MPPRRLESIDYDVEYFVRWDAISRRFNIDLGNAHTGKSCIIKSLAVAFAAKAAQFDAREGKKVAVYSFNADRKMIVEWST
jgi:hypothetical protein